jgi:serine/threonine protein kinase
MAEMALAMNPTAGTLVARRFRLVRELGRGNMGTVWLADHETLGVRCAVKFSSVDAERDPAYRERFEREARSVAKLDSPNVVRVLDYDVFDGVPFLAMEWLSGEDLESRLRRVRRLRASEVHRLVTQVARGLERAHAAGIVHRDLKPGNIFLARSDRGEVAKILDFGLAKVTSVEGGEAMTQAGAVLGTPLYMSPEQARSVSDIDHRSDLWSLGVVTYECLLGKLPFDGPSLGEVFARIMFEPIPVPSAIDPDVPPAFDRWWARAACREVDGRFTSAREMADALGCALADEGHSSRSDLASVRSVRPPRRSRGARWLAAAMATTVLAGWQLLPNVPHLDVPTGAGDPLRSATRAVFEWLSRPTAPVAPATAGALPAPPSAPAPSAPPSSEVPPPSPTDVTLVPAPSPTPLTAPAPTSSSGPSAMTPLPRSRAPSVSSTASHEAPVDESLASGSECRRSQHRCDGRVLQVCNESRDGWADVIECAPDTICDATGSGGCASAPLESHEDERSPEPF